MTTHLDAQPGEPGYTAFARVVDGMDVIETIELADTIYVWVRQRCQKRPL